MRDNGFVLVLIVAVVAVVAMVVLSFSSVSSLPVSPDDFVGLAYDGFSDPLSSFTFSNNIVSVSDSAVYRFGYYSVGGGSWQQFTLAGNVLGGNWLTGVSTRSLPDFGPGEHYVVVYSCTRVGGAWDCHGNKWQIKTVNTAQTVPTACTGTQPSTSCTVANGQGTRAVTCNTATWQWVTGACILTTCNANYGNCDQNVANGCEINLLASANNCGSCGTVCSGTCSNGQCNTPTATCYDKIQNQGETGIDCGGPCNTCQASKGPIYYISTSGIDSNTRDGSSNYPWKTLSYACGRVTTPGATIHVNSGNYIDNNRCDLAVGVNIEGDNNSPPTITTSYTYGASTSYGYIRLNSPAGTPVNGDQTISYINFNGNSKASYRAIAVNFRSNVRIHHCNFSYFRLSGINFDGTASEWNVAPQNVLPVGNEVHDCSFISCANLHRSETNLYEPGHIRPQGQSEMKIYNNVFYQKDQAEGYNADIIAGYQNEGLKLYNNTFYKNDIEGEEWNFFYEMHYHRGGIEIYNNTFYGASTVDFSGTIRGKYDFGGKIYDNRFITDAIPPKNGRNQASIDVESFTYVNDLYIYNNYFKHPRVGIHINNAQISMNNIWVYNNIIDGAGNSKDSYSNGILVESNWGDNTPTPIDNLHIYNNVITASNTNYAGILLSAGGDITNLNIRNNIIGGSFSYPIRINDRDVSTRIDGLRINNNIFYNTLGSSIYYSGDITYVNRDDKNNFPNVNPLFVGGSPYNFRPTSSSPARGAGINVGLDKDYAGNYWNNPPSIGAYEYK